MLVCLFGGCSYVEVLHDMEMEFSAEEAVELMDKIDKDGSGILDFEEFVMFVGRIKVGITYCLLPGCCPGTRKSGGGDKASGPLPHPGFKKPIWLGR